MDGLQPPLNRAGSASAKFPLAPRNHFPHVGSSRFWLPSVSVGRRRRRSLCPRRNQLAPQERWRHTRTPRRSFKSWQEKEIPRNRQDRRSPAATPEVSTHMFETFKPLPGSPSLAWIPSTFSQSFFLHLCSTANICNSRRSSDQTRGSRFVLHATVKSGRITLRYSDLCLLEEIILRCVPPTGVLSRTGRASAS